VPQVHGLREPAEESLPAAQDHRRDDDRQLVDDPRVERLTDDLGAAQ
jgi:hypothetical protein